MRMSSRPFWILVFSVFTIKGALAQDAFKVEPTHYKLDFENETVQVVNVHYGPHEKSSLHSHPGGVVVTLTAGHLKFTDEHGKVREAHSMAGEARWFPPFKHSVENLGDSPYNAVYIGIKTEQRSGLSGPAQGKSVKHVLDSKAASLVARALMTAQR
jgi:quercetin dioxygenase-like cupin family protein